MDPRTHYIIHSILRDVVEKGTARRARALGRQDIAGKTGTTNGPTDAWFSGYNQKIVTTAWLGFDQNQKLGNNEYGGSVALPIWMDFMRDALSGEPDVPMPQPNGIVTVKIDPETGLLARPNQANAIFELFRQENVPTRLAPSDKVNSENPISDIFSEEIF
jgi:penicillin-binding protein 1A